ncbi:MAG: TetR/AcrR family transcriptional regulator [Pseudomonadales bacterium]|nr:TetR/AcrR family transcriptional regulator [Pseudomonadales bacterium]
MAYHHGDLPAALLSAVGLIVNEEGIDALTLRAAARRAGVSHGAPAHHFGDKRGMLTAFAKQGMLHLERCMQEALAASGQQSVAGRLVALGLGYLEYSVIHPAHFAVAAREELLDLSDVALIAGRERVMRLVRDVFDAAVTQGLLAESEREAARLLFWSLVTGLATGGRVVAADAHSPGQYRGRARVALELFARRLLSR